ncbi:hypothetical protein DPMN_017001 [Dreissena polymorpha]|uniref:Uncharacterized protein n=1 Tax=Dreissena polymorpha TaxID=45954 RepID=A0A9D4NE25_DREPO|nr:hypothetical protein DPMN_017001 [Dreissena polymorpha]
MDVMKDNAAPLDMNYKQLYFASQKVVSQMETELNQYAKLFESIEDACTLQMCDIHNQVHQYIASGSDICASHGVNNQLEKELQAKVNQLQQQLTEMKDRNENHNVSLRQIIQTQKQRIDDLENELFEQCELLSGQRDAIHATELQYKHEKALFAQLTVENTKLKDCFKEMTVKERETRNHFKVCEEKLVSLQHKLHCCEQHWNEMNMENEYLCTQLLTQFNQALSDLKIKAGCQVPATYRDESANEQEIHVHNQIDIPHVLSGDKSISIVLQDLEHYNKIKEKMEVIKVTFKEIFRCSSLVEKALKSSLSDLT